MVGLRSLLVPCRERPASFPFLTKEALFPTMEFRSSIPVPPTGREDSSDPQEHRQTQHWLHMEKSHF